MQPSNVQQCAAPRSKDTTTSDRASIRTEARPPSEESTGVAALAAIDMNARMAATQGGAADAAASMIRVPSRQCVGEVSRV